MKFSPYAAGLAAIVLTGCTFGAPSATTSTAAADTTIAVNLTTFATGYSPGALTVATGTRIRFVNTDSFAHTATSISGAAFPDASPFDQSALTATGSSLAGTWSSGTLAAGAASIVLLADRPGTYLFGCFFHYAHPMRGQIVVR